MTLRSASRTLALPLAALLALLGGASLPAQGPPARVLTLADVLDGTEEEALRWPVAVAAASDTEVAVADAYRPRLLIFRRLGVSWQLAGATALDAAPVGLAHDGRRYVASLRGGGGLVEVTNPGGEAQALEIPPGIVPGALAAAPGGGLLLFDATADRVLRLRPDGEVTGEIPVEGPIAALAADAGGGFFAALAHRGRVLRFDATGAAGPAWELPADGPVPAWPVGLAADPTGRLVVADRHASRLLVLDATGRWIGVGSRKGHDAGLLHHPAALARLPNGLILVADQGNGRAQIFRPLADGGGP